MAREVLRELLREGSLRGTFRISCRGVSQEYDHCPIDQRMLEVSQNQSYALPAFSRVVLDPELSKAHLILTMGRESEIFVEKNKAIIKASCRQFEQFLPMGSDSYLPDPFLQRSEDYETHYKKLIGLIERGCKDLFDSIPFLW